MNHEKNYKSNSKNKQEVYHISAIYQQLLAKRSDNLTSQYAVYLIDLLRRHLEKVESLQELQFFLDMTFRAWNVAIFDDLNLASIRKKVRKNLDKEAQIFIDHFFMAMVRDKRKIYPDHDLCITQVEVTKHQLGFDLTLTLLTLEDYLDLESGEEEEDDEDVMSEEEFLDMIPGPIDRVGLLVTPKPEFLQWLKEIFPRHNNITTLDSMLYLIYLPESPSKVGKLSKEKYNDIFELEITRALNDPDPGIIQKINYNKFITFFQLQWIYKIFDTEYDHVSKEEF